MHSFFKPSTVRAQVVRRNNAPCLLVAFNASNPPLIWQFDLEKMSNHTITLREKDGEWDLGLLLPQGAFTAIAHFDERDLAEEAYEGIQAALVQGESSKAVLWGKRLLLAAVLLFLIMYAVGSYLSKTFNAALLQGGGAAQTAQSEGATEATIPAELAKPAGPKEIETGVPVSADDVLEAPSE